MKFLPFQPKIYPNLSQNAINIENMIEHPFLMLKVRTLAMIEGAPRERI